MEGEIAGPVAQVLPALRKVTGVAAVTHRSGQNRDIYLIQARVARISGMRSLAR